MALIEHWNIMKVEKVPFHLILILILSACSGKEEITSFQGVVENIGNDNIKVDCSNSVNRKK